MWARKFFTNTASTCDETPDAIVVFIDDKCSKANCANVMHGETKYKVSDTCNVTKPYKLIKEAFSKANEYVVVETYKTTSSCSTLSQTAAYSLGKCLAINNRRSIQCFQSPAGNVTVKYYNATDCSEGNNYLNVPAYTNSSDNCVNSSYKAYITVVESTSTASHSTSASASSNVPNPTSTPIDSSDSSVSGSLDTLSNEASSSTGQTTTSTLESDNPGISTGAIIGIVVGVLVAVLVVAWFVWYRRRFTKNGDSDADKREGAYAQASSPKSDQKSTDTGVTDFSSSIGLGPQSLAGLWDDELIATSRIPRDKVLVQQLINRGGYGEVYYGLYNGQRVALKTLLPELRKSIKHVNQLLDEVRLLAMLDHPRVVHFVGIAWDSLSDLCIVLEYMEGGDLRALLASYEAQGHDVGFDHTKVTIALHVAHALTYLHSLDPPVLHRDLKSKNVLLTSDLQAKITDFGISRERADKTMTAGVGTSLWMAPEVMMGERYDDKADMFSFGVMLSELDLHTLPYSHAKHNLSSSGHKMPAAEALYHLQTVLREL
ncbi:TKL protein kinase [Phytophthora nicotianae P1976]|nr:TKL protein kinase [Phytophthora nicotianae P1976]